MYLIHTSRDSKHQPSTEDVELVFGPAAVQRRPRPGQYHCCEKQHQSDFIRFKMPELYHTKPSTTVTNSGYHHWCKYRVCVNKMTHSCFVVSFWMDELVLIDKGKKKETASECHSRKTWVRFDLSTDKESALLVGFIIYYNEEPGRIILCNQTLSDVSLRQCGTWSFMTLSEQLICRLSICSMTQMLVLLQFAATLC